MLTTQGQPDLTLVAGQASFAFAARVENGTPWEPGPSTLARVLPKTCLHPVAGDAAIGR